MQTVYVALMAFGMCGSALAAPPLEGTTISQRSELQHEEGFVSRDDSVSLLLNAVAAKLGQTVVVSTKAQRKRISGTFNLTRPGQTLERVVTELGLIRYSDGQSLYVYEAGEVRNAIGHLNHASVATLNEFLSKAGLIDSRYSIRSGDASGTFYIAGPPVYVDIVINAAGYIDELYRGADVSTQHVELVKLEHSFVSGRNYKLRDTTTRLPGVADALQTVLAGSGEEVVVQQLAPPSVTEENPAGEAAADPTGGILAGRAAVPAPPTRGNANTASSAAIVVPYPEANSLLIRGTLRQMQMIKDVIAVLDVPRRQIELSLWIIDINKSDLDQLGVNWSGSVGIANKFGIGFNDPGNVSTLDGSRFLASVSALSRNGNASIVSRPVLLTQENIQAHFDSNHSFYAELLSERVAELKEITYGTTISVLPRISSANEVEMQLQIEDGSAATLTDALPTVARTTIDTIARVPEQLSLLIGGYSRQSREEGNAKIPGLGRIPFIGGAFRDRKRVNENIVRVFLIQPRVLEPGHGLNETQSQGQYGGRVGGTWGADINAINQRNARPVDSAPSEGERYGAPD